MVTTTATSSDSQRSTGGTVNTKEVTGRRQVRYNSYDDLLADAERLAAGNVRTLGNWSYGQILAHLTKAFDSMIDGHTFMMPFPLRLFMKFTMKKKMLADAIPAGFQIPKKASSVLPGPTNTQEGLELLRKAIGRVKTESTRTPHPAFGAMTSDEWDAFQLRHCELHMSFVVPT